MKRSWKVLVLMLVAILALFLVGCGEPKVPLTQYQELEKKYQSLAQDVKTLQKTQGELAQQKAEAEAYKKGKADGFAEGKAAGYREGELAQQKAEAEAYKKGKADGLVEGKAAGYREGWEAYSKLWPYPPTYPSYPPEVYPVKFVASVYQGDEFDGGYLGSFENFYPINYDWGLGGPFGLTNYFSVRWEGTAWFETGNYRFRGRADDGFRLYVDGCLLLDRWSPQAVRIHETTIYLSGYTSIRLEYRERTGYAQVSLFWERIGP